MFKTSFIVSGSNVFAQKMSEGELLSALPPKVYTVRESPTVGFYLVAVNDLFQVPSKVYGSAEKKASRCISTYSSRLSSTGILMTGDKGTGKTLTLSLIANMAIQALQMPVVMVQEPYAGERFDNFIQSLGSICLVFDEFGKMYPPDHMSDSDDSVSQNRILSLLDGLDRTRRLVIMTENDESDICDSIKNRPSRAFYHFRFGKLDVASIRDFCADVNIGEDVVEDIILFANRCRVFSFDMLKSIVEEHLRYGYSVDDLVVDLNVESSVKDFQQILVLKVVDKNTEQELEITSPTIIPKPSRRSESLVKVKRVKSSGKSAGSSPKAARAESAAQVEEFYLYLSDSDLVVVRDNTFVYDKDNCVIVTKEITLNQQIWDQLI